MRITLEFALLTAALRLKAVVRINDSLMTPDPTKEPFNLSIRLTTKSEKRSVGVISFSTVNTNFFHMIQNSKQAHTTVVQPVLNIAFVYDDEQFFQTDLSKAAFYFVGGK